MIIQSGKTLDLTTKSRTIISPDDETENDIADLAAYRNGGEGLIKWAEENVRVPIQYGDVGVETWVYLGEMPKGIIQVQEDHLNTFGRNRKSS